MTEEVIIASLALEAPVRKYRIEAILRRKPSLEAPAEACLKALSVAGRLSESALTRYLGLSVEEFDVIAAELLSKFFLRRSGPDFMLTENGKAAIDPDAEGQRREKTNTNLSFEETAFAEAPRGRAKPWMRRMAPREVREDGRPEAAEAFREGFWAWRAREREGEQGDALARVANVVPLGRDTAVIKAPVILAPTSDAAYIDVSKIELGSLASASRREACAERFRETVMAALSPRDGAAALEWIARHVGALPGAPLLDPVSWARRVRSGELIASNGSVLISETAPSLIARGELNSAVGAAAFEDEMSYDDTDFRKARVILWSPPEGEAWRLDADIDAAGLRLMNETRSGENDENGLVTAIFRLRKGEEKDAEKLWNIERSGPFGAAIFSMSVPSSSASLAPGIGEELPQALELVARPGLWALAIAHLMTDRAPIPIPVGIATTEPVIVDHVVAVLRDKVWAASANEWRAPGGQEGATSAAQRVRAELTPDIE